MATVHTPHANYICTRGFISGNFRVRMASGVFDEVWPAAKAITDRWATCCSARERPTGGGANQKPTITDGVNNKQKPTAP